MSFSNKKRYLTLLAPLLALPVMTACGSDKDTVNAPVPMPEPVTMPETSSIAEPIVITIGNHTDVTGPSSNIMSYLTKALEDMVGHYNELNLIPGVELEVVTYDGQFDPSRDIPGYEWLKEREADFIFTAQPSTAITLNHYLRDDQMVLFTLAPDKEAVEPSGNVFAPGMTFPTYDCYTLLKWIAENDPDFPENRPAKIGLAMWNEPYGAAALEAAKAYSKAHTNQYEWEGGYLADFTFVWSPEVEALKYCDYVIPPAPMHHFGKEYRDADYQAKFIGTNIHISVLGMGRDAGIWDMADGMLVNKPNRWWNEDDEMVNLARELLNENRPYEAESIIQGGSGYLAIRPMYIMLELIAEAIENVGPGNFSSQAITDAAESFSRMADGVEMDSFSDTKRASLNYLGMYELRAEGQDLFRVNPDWVPVVSLP